MSPTRITAEPKPPGVSTNIDESLAYGHKQVVILWRIFSKQFTQPQLITLFRETLNGITALHSSQIGGLRDGRLTDLSPRLIFAIETVNPAIALSNGVKKGITTSLKCPGKLKHIWEGKEHMRNSNGTPIAQGDFFSALCGVNDLGLILNKTIPASKEKVIAKALGKHIRLSLARLDIDYISELEELEERSKTLTKLVMGKAVTGKEIVSQLPVLADICEQSEEDLWGMAISPIL